MYCMSSLRHVWVDDTVISSWIREDVTLFDVTTEALGIKGDGVAELITREPIVVACTEEAARIYELAGARSVKVLKGSGASATGGETLLVARGDAAALHIAWRLAQNLVAICSGVATKTRRLVERARSSGRSVCIAATRKSPPGLRRIYAKAVVAGGAVPHRSGLSDSILIFDNHVAFIPGGWRELLTRISGLRERYPFRKIGVEVHTLKEALEAVEAGVEMVQLERFKPEEVARAVAELRRVNPNVVIAVAGGIDEHNVAEYAAAGPDIIVTTAPYYAKPADVTTRMRRAWKGAV